MLSKTILAEMNEQIKHELYSAYLYLSMSSHFEEAGLPGFATWMRMQAAEEQEHAMKFYDHIHDRGGSVKLLVIDEPPAQFGTPTQVFEQVLEHEQKVTALINKIYASAVKESDFASQVFLNWFIEEQVEEEKNASDILGTLKLIGDKSNSIYQLDHQLGKREEE
ncbi:MAG: ferritin [Anaerolineales bacterium]|nr:ferritin [Anaerolineales bacterium]